MPKLPFQQIASKWLKTRIMQKNEALASYMPQTVLWQTDYLFAMLKKYTVVYLKPDKGGGGAGIVRVEQLAPEHYLLRYLKKRKTVTGRRALIAHLERHMSPHKQYLIQQGIHLKQISGRPFDIRVLVQKPAKNWKVMGMVAKVAAKEKIVTNHAKGGTALTVPKALNLAFGWSDTQIGNMEQLLENIALYTANTLSERFHGLRVLGLDIGIDEQGKVWIFEVNTRPQFELFRHTDWKGYRQILFNQREIIRSGMRKKSEARHKP